MRVAVRIRPLRESDQADGAQEILRKVAGEPQVVLGADRAFTFDHVFDTAAAQHEVYEGCAQALVERVLKGYNSTVLAYGQTGSGKTHTMGSIGTPSSAVPEAALGIIPRTVAEIFCEVSVDSSPKNPSYIMETNSPPFDTSTAPRVMKKRPIPSTPSSRIFSPGSARSGLRLCTISSSSAGEQLACDGGVHTEIVEVC